MKKALFYLRLFMAIILLALPISIIIIEISRSGPSDLESHANNLISLEWHQKEDLSDNPIVVPGKITANVNEKTTIYARLPEAINDDSCLGMKSMMQTLEIRINDELIYEYDTSETRIFGKASPTNFHIVDLPNDREGMIISITITAPYERCAGLFYNIFFGPKLSIIQYIYGKYLPRTIVATCLLIVDIALIFASFLFFKQKDRFKKAIFQFIAVFFIAIYFISIGMLTNSFISPGVNLFIIFYSLMFFNLFLGIYYYEKYDCKYKKLFGSYLLISVLNIVISSILQLANVVDLYEMVLVTGALNVVLLVTDVVLAIFNLKHNVKNDNASPKGNFAFRISDIIITLSILVLFFVEYFLNANYQYFHNIPLCIAFLINICMVYGYLAYGLAQDSKNSVLYKAELAETKTYLVQSQMKPHFIFNTLGAIRAMINSNPKKAYDLTTSFSKYLRANIGDISFNDPIPFSKELDHVRAYLDIELERFRGRLNVEFDIKSSDFMINPLTVEPLVENAVKHGVCKKIEGGTVKIKSYDTETCHIIEVIDNGVGFDVAEYLKGAENNKSVGIKYIRYRIEKMGGTFKVDSTPGVGTVARICIKK